jgi:exonuclease VII large subunit
MSEIDNTVADVATEAPQETPTSAAEEMSPLPQYTSDDLAKARSQEKEKLYPQVEKLKEELSLLKQREAEREAEENRRRDERKKREAELAKKKKEEEEAELSAKELLVLKEQELMAQIEEERQERQKALALLEQERRFQEVMTYRQTRLEQERENIIPELIDMIQGNNENEIEQSISSLKEKSAKIFDSVAQASTQSRKEMVGARVTVPASGPLDNDSEQRSYSPDDISNMSLTDYAKNRAKLLGSASNNRGQGLFG